MPTQLQTEDSSSLIVRNARIILPDRIVDRGTLVVRSGRIASIDTGSQSSGPAIDARGMYVCPGFVDMHIHGGRGADFMDGTIDAFETVVRAHTAAGTTSIAPTSTVARHDQSIRFLELCREMKARGPQPQRGLGGSSARISMDPISRRKRSAVIRT